jgi:hypothetical protein
MCSGLDGASGLGIGVIGMALKWNSSSLIQW